MKRPIQSRREIWKGGALGAALVVLALCLAPIRAHSAGRGVSQAARKKSQRSTAHYRTVAYREARAREAAAQKKKKRYRRTRYRRHHYYRRHRVYLPRVPSRERTKQIQGALARGGYYTHDPNGRWDRTTETALRRFQEANGLPPTGKLDAPSLQKLGLGSDVAGVAAPKPVISASQTTDTFLPKSSGPGR